MKAHENYFLLKMSEEEGVKPRNFHEMELDDRILKVSSYLLLK